MASAWTSEARLRSQAPPDPRAFPQHSSLLACAARASRWLGTRLRVTVLFLLRHSWWGGAAVWNVARQQESLAGRFAMEVF